jgi:hypothetical protein
MFDTKTGLLGRLMSPKLAPQEMEERKLMSESAESEEFMPPVQSRRNGQRIELILNLLSVFVFFIGLLMVVSTLNYKQSDKACAAQLSVWCKLLYLMLSFDHY